MLDILSLTASGNLTALARDKREPGDADGVVQDAAAIACSDCRQPQL